MTPQLKHVPATDVGSFVDFPRGTVRVVAVEGQEIGIYNIDGELHAFRNFCPHRGAPICRGTIGGTMLPSAPQAFSWGMDGTVIRCPRHGWEFDLRSGRTLFGIDRRRLIRYEVTVADGRVLLHVNPPRRSTPG